MISNLLLFNIYKHTLMMGAEVGRTVSTYVETST